MDGAADNLLTSTSIEKAVTLSPIYLLYRVARPIWVMLKLYYTPSFIDLLNLIASAHITQTAMRLFTGDTDSFKFCLRDQLY